VDRYRLSPLRDVRARDERVKRNDLAVAVDDARATEADVAAAVARIEAARSVLAKAIAARATLTSAHALALADRHITRRRKVLDDAVAEHARTQALHAGRVAVIDAARGKLTAARADKQVIERHFERWREQQRKLADRRDD
jgi:multidrug efflux pump subunit AcrA (membrane-fusion protein)